MAENITAAVLANLLGVTDRTIRDLSKHGIIVRAGRGFALAESVRRYCSHRARSGANGDFSDP